MGEYSEGVLIGDWNEKLQSKQAAINAFIKKKANNQLLTQKVAKVKENLLRKVPINVQPDGIVRYGDTLQIVNPEFNKVLSSVISHRDVYKTQDLNIKCYLSGSRNMAPSVRNVFQILHIDPNDQQSKPLRYGDDFLLMVVQNQENKFYVQCEIPNINFTMGFSKHPSVTLTDKRNSQCRWKILSHHKTDREDLLNCVVHTNVPVRINHSASNQQLALESRFEIFTVFGVENEISVHTYTNIHKTEEVENSWILSVPKNKLTEF